MEGELSIAYLGEKGRGVVTNCSFKKGTLIEICPVITIMRHTKVFSDWELAWGFRKVALVGGLAHFYNHARKSNVRFKRDLKKGEIRVFAKRDIKAGEELTIQYLCPLWFKEV